jgi:hypothetical protein
MTTQHTPEPLIPAIRQYKHNDGSDGFVIAFDEKLTVAAFAQLEQRLELLSASPQNWIMSRPDGTKMRITIEDIKP